MGKHFDNLSVQAISLLWLVLFLCHLKGFIMLKKVMLFVVPVIAMLFASASSAFTIVQQPVPAPLNQHHRELTVTADPGEMVTLPFPKQNFPIRVEIVVPRYYQDVAGNIQGSYVLSFTIADTSEGVWMTIPDISSIVGWGDRWATACAERGPGLNPLWYVTPPGMGGGAECLVFSAPQVTFGLFVVGATDLVVGQPNKVTFGVPTPILDGSNILSGPITYYVSAWF